MYDTIYDAAVHSDACVLASDGAIGRKHCALSQEIIQSDTTIWSELEMGEEGGGIYFPGNVRGKVKLKKNKPAAWLLFNEVILLARLEASRHFHPRARTLRYLYVAGASSPLRLRVC